MSSLSAVRCTARRCTDVSFSPDDGLILVADKSGDAYSFPALGQGRTQTQGQASTKSQGLVQGDGTKQKDCKEKEPALDDTADVKSGVKDGEGGGSPEKEEKEDMEEEESDSGGDGALVLGHLSMLLGIVSHQSIFLLLLFYHLLFVSDSIKGWGVV